MEEDKNNLILNLEIIANANYEQDASLVKLEEKIRTIPAGRFDELAQPIVKDITSKIDCTTCGNCCRVQEPGVSIDEIEVLAKLRGMSNTQFREEHIAWDAEGVSFICTHPCPFLEDKKCSVYTSRPAACADYPGLEKPALKWRWKQVKYNYAICPIVFNVVERLKVELA